MPRFTPFYAGLALLLLASCGAKTDDTHGTSTDPQAAIGFMTTNPTPPDTATISRDDGVYRDVDGRPYGYGLLGENLPAFQGEFINSADSFDSTNIDKWTVIDVWGIWCGDCIADAPYVAALNTAIQQDPDLDFISIHVPSNENRTAPEDMFGRWGSVEAYFKDKGYSYPTLIDSTTDLRNALQIPWTPSYLLVSPDGVVRGYRTDLSVAGGDPVKDFIQDIAKVRGDVSLNSLQIDTPSIGPGGAAGVKEPISFTMPVIRSAFPDHTVTASTIMSEGDEYPVFNVHKAGAKDGPLFVIEGTWDRAHIDVIATRSAAVKGPLGEAIGETTFAALPDNMSKTCEPGVDDYAGMTLCSEQSASGTFQRVYAGSWTAEESPLVEMRYLPNAPKNR